MATTTGTDTRDDHLPIEVSALTDEDCLKVGTTEGVRAAWAKLGLVPHTRESCPEGGDNCIHARVNNAMAERANALLGR